MMLASNIRIQLKKIFVYIFLQDLNYYIVTSCQEKRKGIFLKYYSKEWKRKEALCNHIVAEDSIRFPATSFACWVLIILNRNSRWFVCTPLNRKFRFPIELVLSVRFFRYSSLPLSPFTLHSLPSPPLSSPES